MLSSEKHRGLHTGLMLDFCRAHGSKRHHYGLFEGVLYSTWRLQGRHTGITAGQCV